MGSLDSSVFFSPSLYGTGLSLSKQKKKEYQHGRSVGRRLVMAAHNLSPSLPAMMALLSLCVCFFFGQTLQSKEGMVKFNLGGQLGAYRCCVYM